MNHKETIDAFFPGREVIRVREYGNGHINDTFKLEIKGSATAYILQRINTDVFKNPHGIIANHVRLQQAFHAGGNSPESPAGKDGMVIPGERNGLVIPALLAAKNGDYLHTGSDGSVWRVMAFIPETRSLELVEEEWQARQAGMAFGWFARVCSDLDPTVFEEAIPDFHRLSFRLRQLEDAIENNRAKRLEQVRETVDFFRLRAAALGKVEELADRGEIPLRVVHNDTKINNLLFRGKKAVAVIDLDTVGPGSLFYDYGDAIRTGANAAMEDERDSRKAVLVPTAFEAYTRAYMKQIRSVATPAEKTWFHLAPVLMTYIMGIRFLADFLNGDTYYKTAYADHNLIRAKVQQALISDMESRAAWMQDIIAESFNE